MDNFIHEGNTPYMQIMTLPCRGVVDSSIALTASERGKRDVTMGNRSISRIEIMRITSEKILWPECPPSPFSVISAGSFDLSPQKIGGEGYSP